MEVFLIAFLAFAGLLAAMLFAPVVILVDSRQSLLVVRWLGVFEYRRALAGAGREAEVSIFRRPVRRPKPGKAPSPPGEPQAKSAQVRKKPQRRFPSRLVARCLGDSHIRRALARQLWKLGKRVLRSVVLVRSSGRVSLPDPAWNGMLAGALAQCSGFRRLGIGVNFTGDNSIFLEIRFHPHRILKAILFFLPGLPYWAVFRQWRALAAARSR